MPLKFAANRVYGFPGKTIDPRELVHEHGTDFRNDRTSSRDRLGGFIISHAPCHISRACFLILATLWRRLVIFFGDSSTANPPLPAEVPLPEPEPCTPDPFPSPTTGPRPKDSLPSAPAAPAAPEFDSVETKGFGPPKISSVTTVRGNLCSCHVRFCST